MPGYPLTNFHFRVDWGGTNIGFSEVTGLEIDIQVLEYRNGESPEYSNMKMPGLHSYKNIVLKRPMTKGDNDLYRWLNTIQLNTVERRDIVISLLNDKHEPTAVWKVRNSWPCRLRYYPLDADGGQVMMEEIELANEGITVQMN